MAGLLEKVRIGFLAQAHNVLDKFVDLNSPQAIKEYIRELEVRFKGLKTMRQKLPVTLRQRTARSTG